MAPNRPKTPVRTVRLSDDQVAALTKAGDSFSEAIRKYADEVVAASKAFNDFIETSGTFASEAHEAATSAAFPGLPEGMTMEEARRRAGAAVDAARPLLHREVAERISDYCHARVEMTTDDRGGRVPVVAWSYLQEAVKVASR